MRGAGPEGTTAGKERGGARRKKTGEDMARFDCPSFSTGGPSRRSGWERDRKKNSSRGAHYLVRVRARQGMFGCREDPHRIKG